MADPLPLPAQLSAGLVAFTIEADNEAAHRLPHKTTSYGASGPPRSLWMTSIAMWFNCLRQLSDDGPLTVAELERRARMGTNLDGMRRWGYVTIDGVGRVRRDQQRPRAKAGSVLELTARGRAAADVWRPVPGEIELRWRDRFGAERIDRLRDALLELGRGNGLALPDFMPIGSVWGVGIADPAPAAAATGGAATGDDLSGLPLISQLARALLAFALDYERDAKLSLAVQLNGLRVLDQAGVALRELPDLTGVSKEAVAMLVKQLQRVGCVEIGSIRGASRGKQVRLTGDRGVKARAAGRRRLTRTLDGWCEHHGSEAVAELGHALAPIVGDGTRAASPLFDGLEPYPDGWRARAPRPERLPWFPMVLHRGGYPDGS